MTDRNGSPKLHRSVFARLVMIMVGMAVSLMMIVAGFYLLIVIPGAHRSLTKMITAHATAIAQQQPDLEQAQEYASQLEMQIRFESPEGSWTTDESLLTIAEIHEQLQKGWLSHFSDVFFNGRKFIVAPRDNGTYIFAHRSAGDFSQIHGQLLIGLLVTMVIVFVVVYLVLKRALLPLKLLNTGVTQLSEGKLDVVVPRQSPDEFGVLTDAFNRMTRRVSEMVRDRDQLLIDVSHELRSPLTRMKVALELLPEGDRRQSLAMDINEMDIMVTELLELHRLDSGVKLACEPIDLVAMVTELADSFAGQTPGVEVKVPDQEVTVSVEALRVRTVLRNLIENALKFSLPDSGTVEVSVAKAGNQTEVRVKDDGIGVPEEQMNRLFEPFFRLDQSRSRYKGDSGKPGGYGLGLSMCKRIMEAHGGDVTIERNPERGLSLIVTFNADV